MRLPRALATSALAALLLLGGPALAGPVEEALRLRQAGDPAAARQLLEKHLADPRARYVLGLLDLEAGRPADAIPHFEAALPLPEARLSLASAVQARVYALADGGGFPEALRLLQEHPQDAATTLYLEGVVHLEESRQTGSAEARQKALAAWTKCRDLKPVSAVGELLRGLALYESGHFAEAQERFQHARSIRGRNRYAILFTGLAQAAQGHDQAALATLLEVQPTFPGNPSVARALGDLYTRGGDLARAESAYREAGDAEALADLLHHAGRLDEAAVLYARSGTAPLKLGMLLAELGRTDEAVPLLQQAVARAEAEPDPWRRRQEKARATVELALALRELDQPEPPIPPGLEDDDERLRLYRHQDLPADARTLTRLQDWEAHARAATDRLEAMHAWAEALRLAPPGSPRAQALQHRLDAARRAEAEGIAAWEANNSLTFLMDVVTGGLRSGSLEDRKKALETLPTPTPGEAWRPPPLVPRTPEP